MKKAHKAEDAANSLKSTKENAKKKESASDLYWKVMIERYSSYEFDTLINRYFEAKGFVKKNYREKKSLPKKLKREIQICLDDLSLIPEIVNRRYLPSGSFRYYRPESFFPIIIDCFYLAKSDLPILLQGESGTGKEMLASFISMNSRWTNKYKVIHIGGMSESIITSELYGYKEGAFTGANEDKAGLLDGMDGGTIFFDEIDKISIDTQILILRLMDSKEYTKVGDTEVQKLNCRYVFAASTNMQEKIEKGLMLPDFYYRISGANINLPNLSTLLDSYDDVLDILYYFIPKGIKQIRDVDSVTKKKKFKRPAQENLITDYHQIQKMSKAETGRWHLLTDDMIDEIIEMIETDTNQFESIINYSWPGNFREFSNYVTRNLFINKWNDIPIENKKPAVKKLDLKHQPFTELEKSYLSDLFREYQGHIPKMALVSEIAETTLRRRLKRFGIS